MGIAHWHEPLLCLPTGYLDYASPATIEAVLPRDNLVSGSALLSLVVSERPVIVSQPKKMIRLTVTDGMYAVRVTIFIVPGVDVQGWREFREGTRINLIGALQSWGGRLQMTGPALVPDALMGRVLPVYEKRRGVVADGAIFDATRHALDHHLDGSVRHLMATFGGLDEAGILAGARLTAPSLAALFRSLHAPDSIEQADIALEEARRLAAFSVIDNARRLKTRDPMAASVVKIPGGILNELATALPYKLTGDQRRAIREIVHDLAQPFPMRRVVSGDVGCGKTVAFMLPALAVQRMGLRAVILTPNALLADQFVREVRAIYGDGAPVQAVTSATRALDMAGNPVLVGTTALLNRLRDEPPAALVICDEQQKFAVSQKQALAKIQTNCLEATATPIPRTTALITHGALDVSIIREMPVVKTVKTTIVEGRDRQRLFDHIGTVVAKGGQVAIVYPLVENPQKEKKSVTAAYESWARRFPDQVGMIHGALSEDEKLTAIARLKDGTHRIAVVSTVIEIGLTLPDLRSLVVVNAERHGTATLHQLRGRVARHGGIGWCFLYLPDPVSTATRQRLALLERFTDGFALAEQDAQIRGYGDLFEHAERQHGNSRSTVFFCADLRPEDLHQFSGDRGDQEFHPSATSQESP